MGTRHIPSACQRILDLAERNPRRILPHARRALQHHTAQDPLAYVWGTYTLGKTLLLWERLDEARGTLQHALDMATSYAFDGPVLYSRQAMLMLDIQAGVWEHLHEDVWQDLVDCWYRAGIPIEAARTRLYQIEHLYLLVRSEEAYALAQHIEPLINQHGTLCDYASWLMITASILPDLGQLNHAFAAIDKAAALFRRCRNPRQVAICQFKRSWMNHRLNQLEQAQHDLEHALATFQRLDLPVHTGLCKRNLGLTLCKQGNYGPAMKHTLQAQQHFAIIGRSDIVADCDLNLGNIAYYTRSYDIALAHYRHAQYLYARATMHYHWVVSQRNQAMVLSAQGRPEEAFNLLQDVEAAAQTTGEPLEIAHIIHAQAQSLMDMGHHADAMARFKEAQNHYEQLGSSIDAAISMLNQGWLSLVQNDAATASAYLKQAQPHLGDSLVAWRVNYGMARCAEMQDNPTLALRHYQKASTSVARVRQRLANQDYSSKLFAEAQQLYQDALRLALETRNAEMVLTLIEQHRALVLQRQIASIELHIPAELQPIYAQQRDRIYTLTLSETTAPSDTSSSTLEDALTTYLNTLMNIRHSTPLPNNLLSDSLDVSALRTHLDSAFSEWLVLVYAEWGDTLLIVALESQHIQVFQTPYDETLRDGLDRACQKRWHKHTYRNLAHFWNRERPPWEPLEQLGNRLIPAEMRARLHPDKRLILVPCGALHRLSWAALRVEGDWLCQRAIIQILPALSLWSRLAQQPVIGDRALLIGCSEFGPRANPLPYIPKELDLVAHWWRGNLLRLDEEQATRPAILALSSQGQLQRYRLIHVGTHAQLLASQSLQAHIKLWDDDLLLDEVTELRFGGALVVLATCDGAASAVFPGEEVRSLSYAFLAAGAKDVLANIWPLQDGLTEGILTRLYQALNQGMDAPTALATVLRSLVSQSDGWSPQSPPECSPLIWGGFMVQGAGIRPDQQAGGTRPACDPGA
jgi:CHAT domain-containing protein